MTPTSDLIVGLCESIFLSIRTKLQEPDQAGRQIDVNVPGVGGVFRFVPPKTAISRTAFFSAFVRNLVF
jgi:hypothetical protein